MKFASWILCLLLVLPQWVVALAPSVLYVTWFHDPTTTMTVQWHTKGESTSSEVWYRKEGTQEWLLGTGLTSSVNQMPLFVHTVEIEGLEPDSAYEFHLATDETVHAFRTLPNSLEHPVTFVVGGDAYYNLKRFCKMNAQIAKRSPDFVVVGGDIAYTDGTRTLFKGRKWQVKRWRRFLKEWSRQLITSDGYLIPLVPVLGNHDIRGSALRKTPLFHQLFRLPQGLPYRALRAGDYLSLFLLDTGHEFHIRGQQTQWLEAALQANRATYQMAAYHVSAYPSVYPFSGSTPTQVRTHWSPLFEQYGVQVAFEHHNHAYKRTFPIQGVTYMGDGSWGVSPRETKDYDYLAKRASSNAVCVVTLESESALIEALDSRGRVFDQVSISRH